MTGAVEAARDLSRYKGARALVTGATGLIGSNLVLALVRLGAVVHAFVIPEAEPESLLARSGGIDQVIVHRGRLEDEDAVSLAVEGSRPSVVFHLGAQTLVETAYADPITTFEANIGGTWRVLEACRRLDNAPWAIAVASSDKAYGPSDHLPYVETDALAGQEPYEVSKAATDGIARTYGVTYGLKTRIARCGNVYGPGDLNWSRIVPGTIRSLLRGERPVLRSDGTPVRDYLHVDDVVAAYLVLGLAPVGPGEAFNFSSGDKRTVREVVRAVATAVGSESEPIVENRARGEIPHQWLDSTKARVRLGWTAKRRMEEALPSVVEWYRQLLAYERGIR
jgi:CDP-glucose 4,6-dehydratase